MQPRKIPICLACHEAAIDIFQNIEQFDRLDDAAYRIGLALCQMGQICWQTGHPDVALQRYLEALSIFENLDATEEVLLTLQKLCQLHEELGSYGKALTYRQQALTYKNGVSNRASSP